MSDSFSSADEIKKLYGLLQDGIISQDEFDSARKRILAGETPGQQAQAHIPRMVAPAPPTYEEPDPGRWSNGKRTLAAVIFFIVVALAIGFFGDSSDTDANKDRDSRPTATVAAVTNAAESQSNARLEPYLTVLIVMMNTADTDVPGATCQGAGEFAAISAGSVGSATAIGGHQDYEGEITAGTVDQYGHCRMAFAVPFFESASYLFGFDGDSFVECPFDALWSTESGMTAEVRIAPGGRYCQPPI